MSKYEFVGCCYLELKLSLAEAIEQCAPRFQAKLGYFPRTVVVRRKDIGKRGYERISKTFNVMFAKLQPNSFIFLYAERKPKKIVERIPV